MADAAAGQRGSGLFKAADVRERAHGSKLNSAAEGSCQTTAQLAGKGLGGGWVAKFRQAHKQICANMNMTKHVNEHCTSGFLW